MQQGNNDLMHAKHDRGRTNGGSDKASLNRNIVRWTQEAPYLERNEERDLALKWHDDHDDAALHKIAAAHARLVMALAVRFKQFNLPLADLLQEG